MTTSPATKSTEDLAPHLVIPPGLRKAYVDNQGKPQVVPGQKPLYLQLTPMQSEFFESDAIFRGFTGGRGAGKALALTTPIPTPSGWTTMGDLALGQAVLDDQGAKCSVVALGPIQENRTVVRLYFTDAGSIVADLEHEWLTFTYSEPVPRIRTTREILLTFYDGHQIAGPGGRVFVLELAHYTKSEPVRCIEVDSPTHLFLAGEGRVPTHNSHLGAIDLITRLLASPEGSTYMILAPTYGVLQDTSFRSFMEHITHFNIDCKVNGQSFIARFPGKREVLFRTAERPGRLRGKNLSGIWMDEAGEIGKDVYDIVIACLRQGGRQGWLTATFTPKGRQHWTYETFGQDKPNTRMFRSPTRENVFLPETFEGVIRSQYTSKRAQQELEGEFIDMSAGVFERQWFEIVKASPSEGRRVRFWDKAATEGGGCFTAGVLINKSKDGLFYVEHVARAQLSALNRNKLIEQTARDDAQRYGKVEICVEEEPGSGGKESAEFTIRQLAGFSVYAERPSGDKVERAQPLAAQAEAGNVKLVEGPWNRDYLDELCSFPEGRADQVDASSAAFNRLNNVKKKFWMAI